MRAIKLVALLGVVAVLLQPTLAFETDREPFRPSHHASHDQKARDAEFQDWAILGMQNAPHAYLCEQCNQEMRPPQLLQVPFWVGDPGGMAKITGFRQWLRLCWKPLRSLLSRRIVAAPAGETAYGLTQLEDYADWAYGLRRRRITSLTEDYGIGYRGGIYRVWARDPAFRPGPYWKLHITADSESAQEAASIVLPVLRQLKIEHKVVASIEELERQAATTQIGKFITIYPATDQQLLAITTQLDDLLAGRGLSGPPIPGEKLVGAESGLIFARYGSRTGYFEDPTGQKVSEQLFKHTKPAPDWVPDPWKENP